MWCERARAWNMECTTPSHSAAAIEVYFGRRHQINHIDLLVNRCAAALMTVASAASEYISIHCICPKTAASSINYNRWGKIPTATKILVNECGGHWICQQERSGWIISYLINIFARVHHEIPNWFRHPCKFSSPFLISFWPNEIMLFIKCTNGWP